MEYKVFRTQLIIMLALLILSLSSDNDVIEKIILDIIISSFILITSTDNVYRINNNPDGNKIIIH